VSVLFDAEVPSERIADLVGHKSDIATKTVYRHLIKPMLRDTADVIDSALDD